MRRILVASAGVVATTLAAGLVVRLPLVGAVLVAAFVAALIMVIRPAWSIYLTLILACTALPTFIPTEFQIAGGTVRAHEPFLALAFVYSLVKYRATKRANLLAVAFAASVASGLLIALAQHNPLPKVIYDARPIVETAIAIVIAVRLYGTAVAGTCVKVFIGTLRVSAVVVLAGSILGVSVGGRTEEANLADPEAISGAATRLLTAATFPALAALCAVAALVVAGKVTKRDTVALSVPSLVIVVLSFSRNSILALAVAMIFAALMSRTTSAILRVAGIGLAAVGGFALLLVLNPILAGLPGGDFINTQVSSYAGRVLNGINLSVQASDISVQFRVSEDSWLLKSIATSPVFGHGFGYAYKPSAGNSSFTLDYAPYYAHNFYLWLVVKAGLVGGFLFISAIAGPLVRAVRAANLPDIALAASLAGMLASSFVAPVALSATSCVLFGGLFGALIAATEDSTERASDVVLTQKIDERTPLGRTSTTPMIPR